jgi:preprotein translocase subunit SecE
MSLATEYTEDDEKPSKGNIEIAPKRKSPLGRLGQFYHDVKLEMRKTSWPTRSEVWSTTVVVLIAVVFFGFYLWGVDFLVTLGFEKLENVFK